MNQALDSAVLAPYRLTLRQRMVLWHFALGLTDEQIGYKLGISPKTVNTHATNILSRMACHNRAQAVAEAFCTGLLRVRDRAVVLSDEETVYL